MLDIKNKKLCEFCFAESVPGAAVCPQCGGAGHVKRFHGTLERGAILAGRYMVGRVIGKGGFGVTYQCYDLRKDCVVALKEYMPDSLACRGVGSSKVLPISSDKEDAYKRGAAKFFEEAKLISKFNGNPNIAKVYEFFYENNTAYYSMEYLDGSDLKDYMIRKGGKVSERAILGVLVAAAKALGDLHSVRVLHRDISPSNIFVCRNGVIKLIDFGAARQLVSEASNSLSVILNPGFAPFEQYQKKGKQGPWTDIYALGATAYYSVTGRIIPDAMTRNSNPNLDMSGISPELAAILAKMLAVDIKERYANVGQLAKALSPLVNYYRDMEKNPKPSPPQPVMPNPRPVTPPGPKPGYEPGWNFCVLCGKPINPGWRVCADCAQKKLVPKEPSGFPLWIIPVAILGTMAVILLIVAICLLA